MTKEEYDNLSERIIGAAIEVHKQLGPGLLESVYEVCMMQELYELGIEAQCQVEIPLFYHNKPLNKTFKIDILVEDAVIVELKAVEQLLPVHEVQLVTYLKLANKKLGLLINFNVPVIVKGGLKRKVNGTL